MGRRKMERFGARNQLEIRIPKSEGVGRWAKEENLVEREGWCKLCMIIH